MQHWKSGGHKKFCMTPAERRPEVVAAEEGQPLPRSLQSPTDEGQCSICLDTLDSASVPTILLSCAHEFHATCVEGLRKFGVSKVCPVCRGDLEDGPEKIFDEATRRYFIVDRHVKDRHGSWQHLTEWQKQEMKAQLHEMREQQQEMRELAEKLSNARVH